MTPATVIESDLPSIPRYWWLKRITALVLAVFVLLVLVRLAWGWDANRRLEAALAEIRARGEPIAPADFVMPHVPDEQNYVYYFEQATAAIDPKAESPAQSIESFTTYPPYPPRWHSMAKAAMEASPNAFKISRQARSHLEADWRIAYATPMVNSAYDRRLNGARNLANLLSDTALYQHLHGNDAEAMELILDVLAMADATSESRGLVGFLVATGLRSLASDRALQIAPALRVLGGSLPGGDPRAQPASPEQVRALIRELLDDSGAATLKEAMEFERVMVLDLMQWYARDSKLLRPMYTLDTLVACRAFDTTIDALERDSYAIIKARFPTPKPAPGFNIPGLGPEPPSDIRALPRELSSMLSVSPRQPLALMLHRRAQDLMAAVSLAMALYRADHEGNWPVRLDELVPDYLPSPPADPFSESGKPLQYVVLQGTRKLIYSVGHDGVDDTAAGTRIPPEPQFGAYRTPDLWQDLFHFHMAVQSQ